MATKVKPWPTGGNVTLTYGGQGNGTIVVESDDNPTDVARSMQVTIETTRGGTVTRTVTVSQAAGPNFRGYGGDIMRLSDGNYLSVTIPNE